MRTTSIVSCWLLVALMLVPSVSLAADGWWPSFSSLNPFAKKEPKSTLPKWPPEMKPLQIPKPAPQPTMWQKMGNSWHKMVDTVNPWAEKTPEAKKPFVPSGVNPPGKGFPTSGGNKAGNPQSLSGFLSQPRPAAN